MAEFRMPILGADMSEGKLVAWRKHPGDRLERGDIIADVETDKAVIEVEVFQPGLLERTLVEPGAKVPVGAALAIVRPDGAAQEWVAPDEPAVTPQTPAAIKTPMAAGPGGGVQGVGPRASPVARQLAAKLGVDLATVIGTGPGGRIQERDVQQVAAAAVLATAPGAAPPDAAVQPAVSGDRSARMRQAIAAAMARSHREIPHFYLATTIDLTPALEWLRAANAQRPIADRLLPVCLLVKAVALALRTTPELNAVWTGDQAVNQPDIHMGQAIALRGGGLVAPALRHADQLALPELMRNYLDLVNRARAGTLRSSEMTDPTITLTSLGDQGVDAVFGLIYPPQVALVGFGKIVERPWSVNGLLGVRSVVTATLAADHRVVDGHRGSLFLGAVNRLLQEPDKL